MNGATALDALLRVDCPLRRRCWGLPRTTEDFVAKHAPRLFANEYSMTEVPELVSWLLRPHNGRSHSWLLFQGLDPWIGQYISAPGGLGPTSISGFADSEPQPAP